MSYNEVIKVLRQLVTAVMLLAAGAANAGTCISGSGMTCRVETATATAFAFLLDQQVSVVDLGHGKRRISLSLQFESQILRPDAPVVVRADNFDSKEEVVIYAMSTVAIADDPGEPSLDPIDATLDFETKRRSISFYVLEGLGSNVQRRLVGRY